MSSSRSFGSSGANLRVCLKVHQITNAELYTSAAGIWHHWFWLWAGAAAVNVVWNGFEQKEVGCLANIVASPGSCLRQQHLSSLIASSADVSHSTDQNLSPTQLVEKSFILCFCVFIPSYYCLILPSLINSTVCWSPHLLFLSHLLLRIHAESTYMSAMCLWEHHYKFCKSIFRGIPQRRLS